MEQHASDLLNAFNKSSPSGNDEGSQSQPKQSTLPNGLRKSSRKHQDYIKISVPEPKKRLPLEWWKTVIAFVYALFNLVLTTVMITVVHERVPSKEISPPLPDKFFDYVGRVEWAFSISEINGMILVGLWCCQWLFLRYKSIAARRFFFIMGTLYLYRCMTIYVTTLPVPSMHIKCAPKCMLAVCQWFFQVFTCMPPGRYQSLYQSPGRYQSRYQSVPEPVPVTCSVPESVPQ
ncbi:UNVERIFIED_CONTAM: hypothetical protein FKN15_031174 [Acipenser sinensis]